MVFLVSPCLGGPVSLSYQLNACLTKQLASGVLRKRARSTRTGGLVLLPTLYFVERDFGGQPYGGGWSYAGQVPDVFQTTLVGFVPGQQYMISTDAYIVFPEFAIRQYP